MLCVCVCVCVCTCFPLPASVTGCFYCNDRYTSLHMHDKKFASLCVARFTDLELLGQQPIVTVLISSSSFTSNMLVNQSFLCLLTAR